MNSDIEDIVSICPHCGKGIKPNLIFNTEYANGLSNNHTKWLAVMQCPICKQYFFVDQLILSDYYGDFDQIVNYHVYPKVIPEEINFDSRLNDLISPDFCTVYKQALIADNEGLNEITGLAFRKAFEILVKDYAAYLNKNIDKQEILKLTLKQTIDKYFKSSEFEPIFRKISWLGNDHSHTFNKHDDYNVNDLKRFIHACISKIISQLDLEELNNIESKNN
ncbi:hypothetical protein NMU03_00885 [Allocoprobacillus halotolerans]|uniref:DUF4145 domain-containing protein n=1 Tax=Allocoprobacillus halotolerans TaxID=2944914 RepID=A0ABY5I5D9_9FIRM|nr:hypothetical protein [Allocoprobacillus halotolerans]UTY39421.1 hypothetical protein NMU03_00885 [Allocoprobacillus halotolerans]